MNTALLDVNLFIALLWPTHEHHRSAHRWIKSRGEVKWASCPITQFAVLRFLSNPAFSPDALPLEQAVAVLKRNLEHPLHEFWPDSAAVTGLLEELVQYTQDYRQVMDAYLLGLAVRKNARLATFDPNVRQLAVNAGKETHVELLSIG